MTDHPLDNPLWRSLTTLHRDLALGDDDLRRYPPEVAPFIATGYRRPPSTDALAALVPADDVALLVGAPPPLPAGWRLDDLGGILQMVCGGRLAAPGPDAAAVVELDARHHAAVLELTALVYPHYFRSHTVRLGRYFGVFDGDRLAAMIGERMGLPGFRELSAICTHPAYLGRGLARRLMAHVVDDLLDHDVAPFLHVSPANQRACALYQRQGFTTRRVMPFWKLTRA